MREDLDQRRFDRNPAILAAVASNINDGPIVAAAKVTDVGAQQFISAGRPAARQDQGAVTFDPVAESPGPQVRVEGPEDLGFAA
jgi:hypothetical protein